MFIRPSNLAKPITQIQQPLPPHTVVAGIPKPANQFSVVPRAVIQMAVGAGFALGALWAQPPVALAQEPKSEQPAIRPTVEVIGFEFYNVNDDYMTRLESELHRYIIRRYSFYYDVNTKLAYDNDNNVYVAIDQKNGILHVCAGGFWHSREFTFGEYHLFEFVTKTFEAKTKLNHEIFIDRFDNILNALAEGWNDSYDTRLNNALKIATDTQNNPSSYSIKARTLGTALLDNSKNKNVELLKILMLFEGAVLNKKVLEIDYNKDFEFPTSHLESQITNDARPTAGIDEVSGRNVFLYMDQETIDGLFKPELLKLDLLFLGVISAIAYFAHRDASRPR